MAVFLTSAQWSSKGPRSVSARIKIIKSKKRRFTTPAKAAVVEKKDAKK